jgi:hypothetical protein
MGRPAKPCRLGLATGIGLRDCRLGQGREARAEAGIGRRKPVGLERIAPAVLSRTERGLSALLRFAVSLSGHDQ